VKSLVAALLLCLTVAANPAAAAEQSKAGEPQTDAALIEGAGFALGDVGYLVVDLQDKRVLAEHNPDQPFIPASVAKIASITPALKILGGDHRFATTLLAEGDVADGILTGSLTLRGGGDPFLTNDDLQAMAKQLAASGIKKVEGKFLYDATALIDVPEINSLQPEAAGYNTGVSALSVNFNRVRVSRQKDGANRSAAAAAVSENLTLPLDAIGVAFAAENLPGPYVRVGPPSEDRWLLSPNLTAQGEDWLPVANPSRITAEVFRAVAAAEGVDLPQPAPGVTPEGAREVVRHESIPLTDIAREVLRYSNNLSAELIGLAASRALTGRKLSLEDSASALAAWWRLRMPDADWTGLFLENHSGLSSKSRVTPHQIVIMLEEAALLPGGADFHELLRQIAWKGVKGSARVKTGTMSYARGLAGYIDTAKGNRLAFAVFFNDIAKRAALDAAFDPRVVDIDPQSRRWRDRALKLEQTLTTGWAERF
jgi:serine-type D-Ala-D-Ala carboxypeptidase/endopeptidase (penicillin-binding protein 4)